MPHYQTDGLIYLEGVQALSTYKCFNVEDWK